MSGAPDALIDFHTTVDSEYHQIRVRCSSEHVARSIATPSSRRRVDGVEEDAMISTNAS